MVRPILFLCVAIAVLGLAVGCGEGNGESSAADASGPLTKAQFIKRAEAICVAEHRALPNQYDAYLKRHRNSAKSEAEVFAGMIKTVLLPSVENGIEKLQALGAPEGDKSEIDAFLNAQQRGIDAMAKLDRLSEGPSNEKYFASATRLAKAYGIPHCGQS